MLAIVHLYEGVDTSVQNTDNPQDSIDCPEDSPTKTFGSTSTGTSTGTSIRRDQVEVPRVRHAVNRAPNTELVGESPPHITTHEEE